ncbi:insulinoma-associated protein 2 [Rhineura floridana]|uniref:insulinoma-associated protein 2 n=1 Tax=Rhineura floridana TaxID=261503 RepID=UPI002AC87330|nr:insulinoma-associated protein 2 [Rhineura floridana]
MPRGFLVKRSRRPGSSYRVRPPGGPPPAPRLEEAPRVPVPVPEPSHHHHHDQQLPQPNFLLAAVWGAGSSNTAAPAAGESQRCARSPASAESFPLGPGLAAAEKLPLLPRTPLPLPLPVPLPLPAAPLCPAAALKRPPRAKAPPAKKPKAARKLSFADEVTTSPVLGLRIKAAVEGGAERPRGARPTLLGEFVCQLCKEPYADPLALAQHRCSRIVRVEYRCPECHKIFSCPANLASHRRWHKPRPPASAGPAQDKENSRGEAGPGTVEGSGLGAPSGELFLCPYCHKTFRRQAYLRKHLGTHQAPGGVSYGGSPPPSHPPPQQITFPCHLCGAHFPSADIRDKHRLWHAQIFSCKHCPSTFFSSPGLTRHINKCHPSENRQVLLLQMPVRPGC